MAETVLRRHYMLTMRLDLTRIDEVHLQSLAQHLQNLDIIASTLCQERARQPDAVSQAYFCHNECRKLQPPIELRQEPIAFAKWIASCVEGADASPELYFLALHQQEYIGVCMLAPKPQESDVLVSGFTGVLPTWAGRGVAKALKAFSLLCAKQRGFRYVETSVLVVNRGMCAINRSLGFETVRRHLHSYPIPIISVNRSDSRGAFKPFLAVQPNYDA